MTSSGPSAPEPRHWRHARDLVSVLIERDLKVLYKRSLLGIGWGLVTPLLQLFIFTVVFRRGLSIGIENYATFVFVGVLVFGWFQTSLAQSGGLITGSRALVTQPRFPLALLPHVTVGVRLFHFSIAVPILLGLLWWQGMRPTAAWLSLPLLVIVQYVLIVALAYPIASINVMFRDTQHIVAVLLQLSIFVTPVFYSLDRFPADLRPWFHLNPMAGIVESWRRVLMAGEWPDFRMLAAVAVVALLLLAAGRRIFEAQRERFAEEI